MADLRAFVTRQLRLLRTTPAAAEASAGGGGGGGGGWLAEAERCSERVLSMADDGNKSADSSAEGQARAEAEAEVRLRAAVVGLIERGALGGAWSPPLAYRIYCTLVHVAYDEAAEGGDHEGSGDGYACGKGDGELSVAAPQRVALACVRDHLRLPAAAATLAHAAVAFERYTREAKAREQGSSPRYDRLADLAVTVRAALASNYGTRSCARGLV